MSRSHPRVLLGVSGSVAAVKAPELVRLLIDKSWSVSCVLTPGAEKFVSSLALASFSGEPAHTEVFGEDAYRLPHLRLAEESDVFLVAPASASLLASFAHGLADDMVSLAYLACKIPVLVAPAMHTPMWEHPATRANVAILKERGVHFIGPYQGPLADRTRGEGRMAEPEDIVRVLETVLAKK